MTLARIHIHWTGGPNRATGLDRRHYHYVIEGDGTVIEGTFRPEDNLSTRDGNYAAHTLNANTGAIGIALAGMRDARERPFDRGPSPINRQQVDALVTLIVSLCARYGIRVTRQTVLTHAEVQPTLGIAQRGKWDITWLPGMDRPGDPVAVGDRIRTMVLARTNPSAPPAPVDPRIAPPPPAPDFWSRVAAFFTNLFRR